MKVILRLYGTLRRFSLPETPGIWEGEIKPGMTINELLLQLGAGKYEANVATINGIPCMLDEKIVEESEIVVVTPIGGG